MLIKRLFEKILSKLKYKHQIMQFVIERKCMKCVHSILSIDIKKKDLFSLIKRLIRHLQFMVEQKHDLARHLIFPV